MPLGKQFEDTFWHGDEGRVHYSVIDRRTLSPEYETFTTGTRGERDYKTGRTYNVQPSQPIRHTEQFSPVFLSSDPTDPEPEKSFAEMRLKTIRQAGPMSIQGMFFHPATGTGLKEDPLIPPEQRIAAVDRALGLSRLEKSGKKKDADLLRQSLDSSAMPTRDIESIEPTSASLKPNTGYGGMFYSGSRKLTVSKQNRTSVETIPEKRVFATQASETPIFNENFREQSWSREVEATENFGEDAADYADQIFWRNPETGEVIGGQDALFLGSDNTYGPRLKVVKRESNDAPRWRDRVEDYDYEKHGPLNSLSTNPDDLVSVRDVGGRSIAGDWVHTLVDKGLQPNLFFGTGVSPDNKKVHSNESFKAIRGYLSPYASDHPRVNVHTRFVPSTELVEEVIPARTVRHRTPVISQSTLVHELGHATDTAYRDDVGQVFKGKTVFRDSLGEGRADGLADHFALRRGVGDRGRGDQLESALSDPTLTQEDLKSSGYSTGFSGWRNKEMRALYAAARIDTRLHGLKSQHPERDSVITKLGLDGWRTQVSDKEADLLTLGHMWEHMPHIREHMPEDLRSTAEKAHAAYKEAAAARGVKRHNDWVQRSNEVRARENRNRPEGEKLRMLEEVGSEPPEALRLFGDDVATLPPDRAGRKKNGS